MKKLINFPAKNKQGTYAQKFEPGHKKRCLNYRNVKCFSILEIHNLLTLRVTFSDS